MSWGGGYVTDVEYTTGYFVTQSPQLLALACLVNGIAVDPPWDGRPLHYLELGAGRGVNACVLAAANPGWRVTGIDFMPGAVADARRLAAEAGLDNVAFIEADLSDFAESPAAAALPEADIISAHGVWSWVADPVRAGIVRLAAGKLRAGGLLHVSYNALPAQQNLLALQRILREAGRRLAGRSDRQVLAGREVAQALAEAGAQHLTNNPLVREVMGDLGDMPVAYLSHEYMNEAWRPCFHADVAIALAPARLDYAGSAKLLENFTELMLTPAQRAIHDRFDDPLMRELVIDTSITRALRHDVYVRGATRLSNAARDAALGQVRLALATAPEAFRFVLKLPAGEATLPEASYRPMVEALAGGPRSIAELAALRPGDANPAEIAMALAGTFQALVAGDAAAGPAERIHRFNRAMARRAARADTMNAPSAMASLRIGAGIPARAAEVLVAAEIGLSGTVPDPAAMAGALLPVGGEAARAELAGTLAMVLRDRLAVWQRLGVVG
jgi:SAM-dependent methyltransferase